MKSQGVDLKKWKDLPATFREMKEETLKTKNNKNWTYLKYCNKGSLFLNLFCWLKQNGPLLACFYFAQLFQYRKLL